MIVVDFKTIDRVAAESLNVLLHGLIDADENKEYPTYSQVVEVLDRMRDMAGDHAFFRPKRPT